MSVNIFYRTSARAVGRAENLEGALEVKPDKPMELAGGHVGEAPNPEQIFAASYAACFISSMQFVASKGGPGVPPETAVTATVGIGRRSDGGFGLTIALAVSLPGLSKADAERLVARAHDVCPYSEMTMLAGRSFSSATIHLTSEALSAVRPPNLMAVISGARPIVW